MHASRWTFPELKNLDGTQQKRVWRACWWRPFANWQTWIAFGAQFFLQWVGISLGISLDRHLMASRQDYEFPIFTIALFTLMAVAGAAVFVWMWCRMFRMHTKRYLENEHRA